MLYRHGPDHGSFLLTPLLEAPINTLIPLAEHHFLEEAKDFGAGMSDKVSALFKIGNGAKKMGQLKEEVERIIAKEKISLEDSIFLENAILQLQHYHESNPGNHED